MKRLISVILTLCLLLSAFALTVHAKQSYFFSSVLELYQTFPPSDGRITIPAGTELTLSGYYTLEDTLVIAKDASVDLAEDSLLQADIINSGTFELEPGSILASAEGGSITNNGSLNIYDGATLNADDGTIVNNGDLLLYGKLYFSVESDSRSRFIHNGTADCDDEAKIIVTHADPAHPADMVKAVEAIRTKLGGTIFAEATDYSELVKLNSSKSIGGICLDSRSGAVTLDGDLTLNKPLWINDCELVLSASRSLTAKSQNLLFSRDGCITCEEGGGMLVIDGTPLICGSSCTALITPVSGSVSLCPDRSAEDRYYPLSAQDITVNSSSLAQAKGTLPETSELSVSIDEGGSLSLSGKLSCPVLTDNGTIQTNGFALDCGVIYYGTSSAPVSGTIIGELLYELAVDPGDGFSPVSRTYASAGDRVYLEYMDVDCDSLFGDGTFLSWNTLSPWTDSPKATVTGDTDEDSYDYGWHYLTMPAYPLSLTAQRDTVAYESTADGVTVTFDGLNGHEYIMVYLDKYSSEETLASLGLSRRMTDSMMKKLGELTDGDLLNVMMLMIFDEEGNMLRHTSAELRLPLTEETARYKTLSLYPVDSEYPTIDSNDRIPAELDGNTLVMQFSELADCYALVGTEKGFLLGDADSDGKVDITDVTAVQYRLAEIEVPDFSDNAADGDRDGDVSVPDATFIGRYAALLDTPYPIGTILFE